MAQAQAKAELRSIPREHLGVVWDRISPLLERGIAYSNNEIDLDEIWHQSHLGGYQVWVMADGEEILSALVTAIKEYPTEKKVCMILEAGGEQLERWIDQIGVFEWWAEQEGCHELQIVGRPGWVKLMKPYGYTHRYTAIGRELEGVHHG